MYLLLREHFECVEWRSSPFWITFPALCLYWTAKEGKPSGQEIVSWKLKVLQLLNHEKGKKKSKYFLTISLEEPSQVQDKVSEDQENLKPFLKTEEWHGLLVAVITPEQSVRRTQL